MEEKIDFVVTWVDGNDEKWLEEKEKYNPVKSKRDTNTKNRYRDMKTMKYWFRAVEKYAPWVNKIYFITWGHLPEWINEKNEKLVIVNHKDYMPSEILPTFNSNAIEMYIHKINGLSEKFVYFNDDMFVTRKVKPKDFFVKGKPKDSFVFNALSACGNRTLNGIISNNLELISQKFNKKQVIKENFSKIVNLKYGVDLIRSLIFFSRNEFTGMLNPHMGVSYLKSSFEEVWDTYGDRIKETTSNRFRTENDVSHWLVRYWQLMSGKFFPKRIKEDRYFDNFDNLSDICKAITKKKYKMICINDSKLDGDFDEFANGVSKAFEQALPEKSSFEK